MVLLSKKGDLKRIFVILVVVIVLFMGLAAILSFAETPEEEKLRLEAELAQLESQLQQIDGGRWVNISSCGVERIFYNNYNCDSLIGFHTVCISNISYYISNYCSLMPDEDAKIKSRILEVKERLKVLEAME